MLTHPFKDCNCSGACKECSVELNLHVKCTEEDTTKDVTSKDLVSHDPRFTPITEGPKDAGILIAKLRKGQEIKVKCIAKKVYIFNFTVTKEKKERKEFHKYPFFQGSGEGTC
jgi:DNA-directed RNA polymerase alpha subunit